MTTQCPRPLMLICLHHVHGFRAAGKSTILLNWEFPKLVFRKMNVFAQKPLSPRRTTIRELITRTSFCSLILLSSLSYCVRPLQNDSTNGKSAEFSQLPYGHCPFTGVSPPTRNVIGPSAEIKMTAGGHSSSIACITCANPELCLEPDNRNSIQPDHFPLHQ